MKRTLLILSLAMLAAACGKKSPSIKIGLSMDTLQTERWQRDRDYIVAKAKELGAEVLVQVANSNDSLQNSQAENLLTQGVQALIVVPHNGKSAATIVESAKKAGVPVLAYDRLIMDSDLDFFVSIDAVRVGELQAEYLVKRVPKGNYVLIEGAATDNNAHILRKGQMKVLEPLIKKGDIKLVADQWAENWAPESALKIMENALTRNKNKVDAVLASNDGTAGGAIQALIEQKLGGRVPVTGQDADAAACQRIVNGTQAMTIYKSLTEEAYKAAEIAVKLARKEPITEKTVKVNNGKKDVDSLLLVPTVVDKANMKETVIKDGFHQHKDVYRE